MDLSDSGWWQVITAWLVAIFTGATFWISWGLHRSFATRSEFIASDRRNEKRDISIETRLTKLETQMEYFPTSESLDAVRNQFTRLHAEMDGLRDTTNRIDQRLGVLYEHQLNKDSK